jgi:hypothetical protein
MSPTDNRGHSLLRLAICDFSLSTRQPSHFPHFVTWPLDRFGVKCDYPQTHFTTTLAQYCGGGHDPWRNLGIAGEMGGPSSHDREPSGICARRGSSIPSSTKSRYSIIKEQPGSGTDSKKAGNRNPNAEKMWAVLVKACWTLRQPARTYEDQLKPPSLD